jgi:large subunit ribosomal protein L6
MSRIGKKPVELPSGRRGQGLGPDRRGEGAERHPQLHRDRRCDHLKVEDNAVTVEPRGKSKRARQQWGMSRTMVQNCVTGVTDGFKKELEIRASATAPRCRATC